jgi:hypothetical protein
MDEYTQKQIYTSMENNISSHCIPVSIKDIQGFVGTSGFER